MKIIGHRGARGLAPGNTLASIQKALDWDVDEVEVDVRVTLDNIPILAHDRIIKAHGKWFIIAEHTLEEIRQYKEDTATLGEALRLVAGRSILHIEVKSGEPTIPVAAEIEARMSAKQAKTAIVLGSKSQKVLRSLHAALPDIPKVIIEPWSGIRAVYRARQIGTKRISMRSWWLWYGFLRHMQRRGYQMIPYTVNHPHRAMKWQPYIYGIVTDYPDRFQHVTDHQAGQ